MKSNILKKIQEKLSAAKNAAIITHVRPDGDCLGSALALKQYLDTFTCSTVFCDDFLPPKYSFLSGFDGILREGLNGTDFDLIVIVDSSDINRIGEFSQIVKKHKNTVNIDHHISNEKFADINYVTESSSTCEIILDILTAFDAEITKDIAECVYCGLSSDTGNFSHSNTTHQSFLNAARLSKILGDVSYINQKIYKEMPICRLQLLSHVTSNIQFYMDEKIAVLYVLIADLQRFGCESYETEGLVDYAINLMGVDVGIILLQGEKNSFKVSLRSKNTDVCKIASDFGGGGHIHASGCMLFGDLDSVIKKVVTTAEFYVK